MADRLEDRVWITEQSDPYESYWFDTAKAERLVALDTLEFVWKTKTGKLVHERAGSSLTGFAKVIKPRDVARLCIRHNKPFPAQLAREIADMEV